MWQSRRWWMLALITLVIIAGLVLSRREPHIATGSFLAVDIGGRYTATPPANLFGQVAGLPQRGFFELLLALRKAAADVRLRGVILKVAPFELSLAEVQEIRRAIQTLKRAGKRVIAWVGGEGQNGNREYYLASVANQVYFADNTILPLLGLQSTAIFLGGVWENLSIDMQVEQFKEYKTFGDFLARKQMTEAQRGMLNALLDSLYGQFLSGIAEARKLSVAQVRASIDAPTLTPEDFHKAGLIDGIRYYDDLLQELREAPERPASIVSLATYRQVRPETPGRQRGPKVAVVSGIGAVTGDESGWSPIGRVMGAETIIKALERAVKDASIKAIVLRIDSPGGSALASDRIWQAVIEAKKTKPVVVSMSSVAASGGYYIAAGATKIVALPATLTGSIGVVFFHPNVQGLLNKLGMHTETLARGRYAGLFDTLHSWSADERQHVERLIASIYRTFLHKVATGRHLSVKAVDEIAGGRVWTGMQARALGLVDALGGMDTALELAKEAAEIPPESTVELVFYPRPRGLLEMILRRIRREVATPLVFPPPVRELGQVLAPFAAHHAGPLLVMPLLIQIH